MACALPTSALTTGALPRILYIASSHGREIDYHIRRLDSLVPVLGLWIGGVRIKGMTSYVVNNIQRIVDYSPSHCIVHLMHNDVCHSLVHNPIPMPIPEAMFNFIKLIKYLRRFLPNAVFLASCPFPRIPRNYFTAGMCLQYNRLAVRAGESMADRRYELRTIFVQELWLSVKGEYAANPCYLKSKDGLHMNANGKRLIASKWLQACITW